MRLSKALIILFIAFSVFGCAPKTPSPVVRTVYITPSYDYFSKVPACVLKGETNDAVFRYLLCLQNGWRIMRDDRLKAWAEIEAWEAQTSTDDTQKQEK